jgi:NAD(P)-dependent dehydrogenase (short-subunit alcohol dehydrogenase family)
VTLCAGVRVNSVSIGFVPTAATAEAPHAAPTVDEGALLHAQLVQRLGVVDDVAGLAAHLLADESSFLTGAHYLIDGGWTLVA